MEVVIVVGASNKPDRYSFEAMKLLTEYGHSAIPMHPREEEVIGKKTIHKLSDYSGKDVDTVTMYVNPEISNNMIDDLINLKPKRVIFNPGSENATLVKELEKNQIKTEEACTLVLLRTGQF